MRPIDADALRRDGLRFQDGINESGVLYVRYSDVLKSLTDAPTLDVAPVVHGEWALGIDADGDPVIYCTNCMMPTEVKTNYCSECGAKMDGKEQDDV